MQNLMFSTLLCALLLLFPAYSGAEQCQQILKLVETYPQERLYELVQKAPQSCKQAVKEKIFNDRGVIIDDFGGRYRH